MEYGTLIIAFVALIQPWVISAWKKYILKGKIEIFPSGMIEVGFSGFGPTIGLSGSFRCINHDNFINSITLKVVKEKDNSTHIFDWGFFRSAKITLKGGELEAELPYAISLSTAQPSRFNILFIDIKTRDEIQNIIQEMKEEWSKLLMEEYKKGTEITGELIHSMYKDKFSNTTTHINAYTNIDRLYYWEAGRYSITMIINSSYKNQTYEMRWPFSLNQDEVKSMRLNSFNIIHEGLTITAPFPYNFAYAKYE